MPPMRGARPAEDFVTRLPAVRRHISRRIYIAGRHAAEHAGAMQAGRSHVTPPEAPPRKRNTRHDAGHRHARMLRMAC